ncbi:MAG: DDE-type integrase/transposase/recombinase [Nitrospirae bacterium]|nr:DDE-type integrase/transposase/recombinase [Nitrospirota bacterium]
MAKAALYCAHRTSTVPSWTFCEQVGHPAHSRDLAQHALTMALQHRTPGKGLLHHSDRGSRYAARRYQRLLNAHGITSRMSRIGTCRDNVCGESFFGTLKRELVSQRHYATREEARQDIFEYLEVFYNRKRRHSALGYDAQAEFEARTAVAYGIGGRSE